MLLLDLGHLYTIKIEGVLKQILCLLYGSMKNWFLCHFQICDYLNIFWFSDFFILLALFELFLTLQNILKFNILVTKSENQQLGKRGASGSFNSRVKVVVLLTSWHVSESLSMIRENMAVPVELVGKLDY